MRHSQPDMRSPVIPSRLRLFTVLCLMLGAIVPVQSVQAQTLFEWPPVNINLAQYQTIEECVSATRRVADSVQRQEQGWADTMPLRRDETQGNFATPIVQAAERCVARFDVSTAPIEIWSFMLDVLLHTTRGASVDSLITRRLALITGTDSAATWTRGAVLDTVIELYLTARPLRFPVLEQRLRERVAITASSASGRFGSLTNVFHAARAAGQNTFTTWIATQLDLVAPQAVTECEGSPFCLGMVRSQHRFALDFLARSVLLDSLRHNTASYARIKQANWEKASRNMESRPMAIGKSAPVIQGDFWYDLRAQTDTTPVPLATPPQRPQPGKVSLVLFLTHECRVDHEDGSGGASLCLMDYAVLRRIAARFPAISITIVSQTAGYYWYIEPPTPANEAAMLARWWPGYHRLPAVLAVANTPHWRIEGLDRRRMNDSTATITAYTLDGAFAPKNLTAVLIDKKGVIVDAGRLLDKSAEDELSEVIHILMEQ